MVSSLKKELEMARVELTDFQTLNGTLKIKLAEA